VAELATLGVESRAIGIDQTVNKLKSLTNAAKLAETAVSGMGSSAANAGRISQSALNGMANQMKAVERISNDASRALAAESLAAQKAASATKAYTMAANQNVAGMVKTHNTANLAAQGFDIVTTAAGGMSAGLIGMQQGLQIAQVAMTTTGGFAKTLGAAFLAMLSPVTLLAVGLTTLAAVGIQQVQWANSAAAALRYLADNLKAIAPYAVAAAAAIALIYAPTVLGGIIQLIALLGRLVTAAGAVAVAFAAANPFTAFVLGAVAAVAALNIFADEIKKAIGVDVVEITKTAANFIINSFEAAFEDIRVLWSSLGDIVGAAMTGAVNLVIQGLNHMVNGAKMSINDLIKAANHVPFVNIGELDTSSSAIQPMDNPYSGRLSGLGADRNSRISEIMSQDRMGQFGAAIASGASTASEKLRELSGWMTEVDKKKTNGGKADADKYSDIVDGANRRIAALQAEQAALGLTDLAAAKLRYETDLLNQAQQKGITLTAAQKVELSGLAGQMASIEIATKQAREAIDFAKSTTAGFINELRNGLRNGESFWTAFGNAALSVLDRITDRLLNQVLDAVFQVSNAGGSGGGGFLSSLFGGLFGGGKSFFPSAPGGLYADGGYTGNGAASNAAGIVHGREFVFSAAATKKIGVSNLDRMHRSAKRGYYNGGYVGNSFSPASPANTTGQTIGQSVVMIQLSPELVGQILQQAQGQTVQIVKQNNKNQSNLYQNGQAQNG